MKGAYPVITLLLLLLLGVAPGGRAQAPTWHSALTAAPSGLGENSVAHATVADAAGNVYVAGSFRGTVRFGSQVLTSSGSYDAFVAKWSAASGSFVWAWQSYGLPDSRSVAVGLALNGPDVYVAGHLGGTQVSFGGEALTNTGPWQTHDVYVLKLTETGSSASMAWVQQALGPHNDQAAGLGLNGSTLYVAGYCEPGFTFGSGNPPALNSTDAFVARLEDTGRAARPGWVWTGGGTSRDEIRGLVVQGNALYVAGFFYNGASFGGVPLSSAGDADVFAAKLLDTGPAPLVAWAQRAGGSGLDLAEGLALSGDNLYLTGVVQSPAATFGPLPLPPTGGIQSFVAKLSASSGGSFGWVRGLGGVARAVQASGRRVYVAGSFSSGAAPATFGTTTLTSLGGGDDVFVAGLTDAGASGDVDWALPAGSYALDKSHALTVLGEQEVLVSGHFNGPIMQLGSHRLTQDFGSTGALFMARLAGPRPAPPPPVPPPTTLPTDLAIFPNPAHGAATVQVPAGAGPATVQVLDALGRAVWRGSAPAGQDYPLDLTGLAAGVYLVRAQTSEATVVQRLLVE